MEASQATPAAPAAPPAEGQQQQAAAPPAPAPAQTPAAPAQPGQGLGEQQSDFEARLAALEQGQQPGEQPPAQEGDLYGALNAEPTDAEIERWAQSMGIDLNNPDHIAQLEAQLAGEDPQGQFGGAQLDPSQLDQLVDQRVAEAVSPIYEQRQAEEINALSTKYPDLVPPGAEGHNAEVWGPMTTFLQGLVERHDNPALATDPQMVERAYLAVKAEQANAAATPAEQAATAGASLETNAGPSQQGESDPVQRIREGFQRQRAGQDHFT